MLIMWGPEGPPPVCPNCGSFMLANERTECINCGTAEPARAEAPQGETDHAVCTAHGLKECEPCVKSGTWTFPYTPPAAQPETGDEARVRQIMLKYLAEQTGCVSRACESRRMDIIVKAVREAHAAGRAAENEACEAALRADSRQRRSDGWDQLADELMRQADAIAARRGRGK